MSPLGTDGRPRRFALLAVDDDPGIRETYALLFEDTIDVVAVGSALTAITAAHQQPFDAILLDVRMPHMSGFEAYASLRAAQPDVPIIFVTAVDSVETAVNAMRLGAFDYVVKPFIAERLVTVVERAIASSAGVVHVVDGDLGLAAAAAVVASARAGIPATLSPTGSVVRTVQGDGESFQELYARIAPGAPAVTEVAARVATYVGAHYPRVNVEYLAEAIGLSASHLSRAFCDDTTLTAKEYVTHVRIEVARYLLTTTPDNLEVIADRVGLWDTSHRTRVFRQHVGVTSRAP